MRFLTPDNLLTLPRVDVDGRLRVLFNSAPAWSPLSWFAASEQGAWYDPTDLTRYMDVSASPQMITNGGFDSATGWTLGSGVSIAAGKCSFSGVTHDTGVSQLAAQIVGGAGFTTGKMYEVTFEVSNYVSGSLYVVWPFNGGAQTGRNGIFRFVGVATDSRFALRSWLSTCTFDLDNISVREIPLIGQATMYQDAAGTTPVTAVEQPVGLILDRRLGALGALGANVVPNGDFASSDVSAWQLVTGANSWAAGVFNVTGATFIDVPTTSGRTYRLSADLAPQGTYSAEITVWQGGGFAAQLLPDTHTTASRTRTGFFTATASTSRLYVRALAGAGSVNVDNISVREVPGNHATQATSTARPTLRNRYNLLTFTEDPSNAAWTKVGVTVSTSTEFAGAALITGDGLTLGCGVANTSSTAYYGVVDTSLKVVRVRAKRGTGRYLTIQEFNNAWRACFDLQDGVLTANSALGTGGSASIQPVGDGSYDCTWSLPKPTQFWHPRFSIGNGYSSPATTETLHIGRFEIVHGADASLPYQRVTTATDYDSDPAKFPLYLAFDGSDDSMATGPIDFSATDEMTVVAGVTKLSDAGFGGIVELSAEVAANNGSFLLRGPEAGANYFVSSRGTVTAQRTLATYAAPITNVITLETNISTPLVRTRINGAVVDASSATQGAGNYGNYPLFIGARNNGSLRLNGRIHQLIIRGKASADIAQAESFVAARTGVTL